MDHIVGCEVPEATEAQERLVTPGIRQMPKTGGPWTSSGGDRGVGNNNFNHWYQGYTLNSDHR
jgi:hypothetical protein